MRKKPQPAAPSPPNDVATAHPFGVRRFDSNEIHLPEALAEAGEAESHGLMPGRVVLIIVFLAIVFISIMAWFVSRMPEK